MVVLGLTGSIGMGKTTAARMLRTMGVPVCDSDRIVHQVLATDRAVIAAIAAMFPSAVVAGCVDRRALGQAVFGDVVALRGLEALLHPRVRAVQDQFLMLSGRRRRRLVCLDIPLLFETGGDRRVDRTIVVTAPGFVQRSRVLGRAGMTRDKLNAVLAHQMPDREKRRRADYVVPSGLGRRSTRAALRRVVRDARGLPGRQWPPRGYRLNRFSELRPDMGGLGKPAKP